MTFSPRLVALDVDGTLVDESNILTPQMRAAVARVTAAGVPVVAGDGLSLWVPLPVPARAASEQLMRRGWLVRPGDEFVLQGARAARHLRITVHDLSDAELERLASDLAAAIPAAAATSKAG